MQPVQPAQPHAPGTTGFVAGWRVSPGRSLSGSIEVPGDKSVSHRALMLGGIASGLTRVSGFLESGDCLATLAALRALDVRIERPAPGEVLIHGGGAAALHAAAQPLDMGNSGTAMRLFMGLLAGRPFESTLVGDASLTRRPMERVAAPLRAMGARIDTESGRPPVRIHGHGGLRGVDHVMNVASAQVKSALLLAGLAASGRTSVHEPATTRDHTERMLATFGVRIARDGQRVSLDGGQLLRAAAIEVPGDFSSAAFFLVGGALGLQGPGVELQLRNVGLNPTRSALLQILSAMGADLHVKPAHSGIGEPRGDITVRPSALRGVAVPRDLVPIAIDEFPVFFIAAACAEGASELAGAEELRVKESDRLAVMAEGLGRLGVRHELRPDGMRIEGRARSAGAAFTGGTIDSHGDHRIAMAFAMASLRAAGPIEILDTRNVATSFPGFAALARGVGLVLEERGSA